MDRNYPKGQFLVDRNIPEGQFFWVDNMNFLKGHILVNGNFHRGINCLVVRNLPKGHFGIFQRGNFWWIGIFQSDIFFGG